VGIDRFIKAGAALGAVVAALALAGCGSVTDSSADPPAAVSPTVTALTLQERYVQTVKAVSPSVVQVETPVGLGSGVVLDTHGNVVTNAHVVGAFTRFQVTDSSGRRYSAQLVGKFVPDDLAVINVSHVHARPLPFGNSSRLQVGDIVLSVGSPLGFQGSVAEGIVSALGRTVTEQNGSGLPDVIQTTAAINPGNSGGALVDLSGRFVGMPTLAAVDNETAQLANGIGFAIPSNTVKDIARQLVRHGHVVKSGRAYLGVRLASLPAGLVTVVGVAPHGPAAKAGVVDGDVITAIDGTAVRSIDDIAALLADRHPGAKVKLDVRTSSGRRKTLTVTTGQYPGG
jgi:putative serine protease PepD